MLQFCNRRIKTPQLEPTRRKRAENGPITNVPESNFDDMHYTKVLTQDKVKHQLRSHKAWLKKQQNDVTLFIQDLAFTQHWAGINASLRVSFIPLFQVLIYVLLYWRQQFTGEWTRIMDVDEWITILFG